ncbi:hypothetical protein BIY21_17740 [Vibrio ponticus]|uniref:OmpR/PhoB-type domain-containing protein n=1 Tax=Vibrio ponticus TaxID=265668 RepID=A0ABX3F894_9VIBR|nr:hypothetical protein BIY21_17740 [Vibrio ponticus]
MCCLLDASPKTLSKEDIIEKVWDSRHISPESLPQLIIRTRQALGDSKKTVLINEPGIGYKLNFSTRGKQSRDDNSAVGVTTPISSHLQTSHLSKNAVLTPEQSTRKLNFVKLLVIAILLIAVIFQCLYLLSAVRYKNEFKSIGHNTPYPFVQTKDEQTIVTIDNYECIYQKDRKLLSCQK